MIPVSRPYLPPLSKLTPYIVKIDANRYYSNSGPIERLLKNRLADHFSIETDNIELLSSGTIALILTLNCVKLKAKYCLIPAWAFSAVALATMWAGLTPILLDIEQGSYTLSISSVRNAVVAYGLENIAAIVIVSYLGSPVDLEEWRKLYAEIHVPIIIDAASGFDTLICNDFPTIISFHATKIFSTGEGGCVISEDVDLIKQISQAKNFGFDSHRITAQMGLNGKMNEYSAAIGSAFLDMWFPYRERYVSHILKYQTMLDIHTGVRFLNGFGSKWVSSQFAVTLNGITAANLTEKLKQFGIETKMWWQRGLQEQALFKTFEKLDLYNTSLAASQTIGLPLFYDITAAQISCVCEEIQKFTTSQNAV